MLQVKDASIAALEAVQNVLAAMHIAGDSLDPTVKPDLLEDPNFTIRERLQAMLTPTLKVSILVVSLSLLLQLMPDLMAVR